ncbi:MAG: hypothetical protein JSV86_09175 [Gemmatimonadota bacterium]|nr:MAG: hypothetical protein JSV86_09175 [Gemmatimonadota bacterium]
MTRLLPTAYSDKNNSTFFDVGGTLITVGYEVIERKRWFLIPGPSLARVEINVGDGESVMSYEYSVPRNRRVGPEIAAVERGLYSLLDNAVRTTMQMKVLEASEREVEALELEHLFEGGSAARDSTHDAAGARRAREQELLSEVVDRLVTAIRHVTRVTSLTADGLEAHQRDRTHALERVVESTSLTSVLEAQGVLGAVEAFLAHEVETATDVNTLRERTLGYLDRLRETSGDAIPAIGYEQAHIITNEFVPAYVVMKRKYDAAAAVPSDVLGHAFGSFFGGGITGWLTLSVFGEAVIRNLTGVYLDIPGWYIGAAVAFIWPYIKAAIGMLTRDKKYEKRRQLLLRRLTKRLELVWPEGGRPLPG